MRSALVLIFSISLHCGAQLPNTSTQPAGVNSPSPNCGATSDRPVRVFPSIAAGCGRRLAYLGTYYSDGKYHPQSLLSGLLESSRDESTDPPALRPAEVPDSVDLHPRERAIENMTPGSHAVNHLKGRSTITELRDDVMTFVYGREKALLSPRYITTDTRGRAIISDPALLAVHVLDRDDPFRIVAGGSHRLQSVGAVAVDKLDNIFIADPQAGLIQVFDSDGRFFREIGRISEDEGIFHDPEALAIDRRRQRLYVADASRDMVLMLNIEGKVLQRAGGRRAESGATFNHPNALTVKHDEIVVLDSGGARIQVFDLHWKLLEQFSTRLAPGYSSELGLDVDSAGNIYLSNIERATIRVFDKAGRLTAEFGRQGTRRGEFLSPTGIWIDADDRLYVSEKDNRRVQVFQLSAVETAVR
jgi:sugar lactone lactonase YvrE